MIPIPPWLAPWLMRYAGKKVAMGFLKAIFTPKRIIGWLAPIALAAIAAAAYAVYSRRRRNA